MFSISKFSGSSVLDMVISILAVFDCMFSILNKRTSKKLKLFQFFKTIEVIVSKKWRSTELLATTACLHEVKSLTLCLFRHSLFEFCRLI
jgi:hypothetical protein